MTKITILDGARTIGGSKIHLQSGGTGILLDFGMNYKRYGLYYEEFVGPRSARGISDLLTLGIIPRLRNLYRGDVFPTDFDFSLLDKEFPVEAVFVSHAHTDHCAHIGLLREDIPIFCSPLTALLMKAMQDTGKSGLFNEMVYITKREVNPDDPRLLKAGKPKQGKLIFVFGDINEAMEDFWERSPYAGRTTFEMKPMLPAENKIGSVGCRYFPVDHSILGATAYAFQTEGGWIAYTGDIRLHGKWSRFTEKFLEEVGKLYPLALIIEGTHINEENEERVKEEDVYNNCLREIKIAEGKMVVADFAPRNLERLQCFLQIAKETKRQLLILPKDMYLLEALDSVQGTDYHKDENIYILEEMEESREIWEKELKKRYQSRFVGPNEIKEKPGDYILCLSFFDIKHLTDVASEKGGIYIYSSSEAYTEEQEIDFRRLKNWLDFLNLKPIGFYLDVNDRPRFQKGYHSSGHAGREELLEIVKCIHPKYLIPVHTEAPEVYQQELSDSTHIMLENELTSELEVNFFENS